MPSALENWTWTPVPLCDLVAMRAQRRGEAQQAKRRRMEVVRQAADALERVACLAIELGDALLHFRILEGAGGVLQAADADRHRGQPLADVVVQIAGDLGARRFLRVDQAARHLPNALVARAQRRFPRPDRVVGPAQPCARLQQPGDQQQLGDHDHEPPR